MGYINRRFPPKGCWQRTIYPRKNTQYRQCKYCPLPFYPHIFGHTSGLLGSRSSSRPRCLGSYCFSDSTPYIYSKQSEKCSKRPEKDYFGISSLSFYGTPSPRTGVVYISPRGG